MPAHEKIRFLRQAKGWTQEEVADKLKMSQNGYGSIERGETDVNLSRLEQIAELFEIKLSELLGLDEKAVFNQSGTKNNNTQNYHVTGSQSLDYLQLKSELEKQQLLNGTKDREIELLKEVIALMKKEVA
ncbi:MAG: helix-turn-helix transcriptional regulator [Methylococcales bacterium]|nr:helix-turn-helix transcriptional regulator [Methylococcales bacterium]